MSKRFKQIATLFDSQKVYKLEEAIAILQQCPPVKFDQSVGVAIKVGVDTQQSDQQVRGIVSLPHGRGKKLVVVVFAKGEKVKEALDAGADFAGDEELIKRVGEEGWTDFAAVVATPDMMAKVGKLGKILGPRGLMPTPKAGSVTTDVGKAVQEIKGGKIEFKSDKHGVVAVGVGKLSFPKEKLVENIEAFIQALARSKPAASKGHFIPPTISISSTMGPGLKVEIGGFAGG